MFYSKYTSSGLLLAGRSGEKAGRPKVSLSATGEWAGSVGAGEVRAYLFFCTAVVVLYL